MTDSIISHIKEWQNRPLNPIYPFVFMDAIYYKVREDGDIKNRAAYVVVGVNLDGFKDVLGIWIQRYKNCDLIINQLSIFFE